MFSNSGFFQRSTLRVPALTIKQPPVSLKTPGTVYLNGQGGLACAVAIVDRFLAPTLRNEDNLAGTLLPHLFKNFPNYPRPEGSSEFLTPPKYMQQLCLQQDNLRTLLESLSFTLNRLAIEHMLNHPRYYQSLFNHPNKPFSISSLRDQLFLLNPWIIDALTTTLPLDLRLIETQEQKTLAKNHPEINNNVSHPPLIMHWQGDQCLIATSVEYSAWFSSLNSPSIKTPPLSTETIELYATRANEHVILLEKENQTTLQKYSTTQQRLKEMIIKQNLSEKDIRDIYIHSLIQDDDSVIKSSNKKQFNIEYGSQHIFERLQKNDIFFTRKPFQNERMDGLVDALSRSIALGLMHDVTQKMRHHERPETPEMRGA